MNGESHPSAPGAELRAGVAKVCITPPVGTWQGGYGARVQPSEGIHDDLYARALVLDDGAGTRAAVVGVDVVGLPHALVDAARQRAEAAAGIPAGNVALCTSHTHGGPATRTYADFRLQPDQDYLQVLEKHLAGAVAAAARNLRPAAIRLGRGQAGFNVNRRLRTPEGTVMRPNPEGPVDRDVLVLRVDALDDVGSQFSAPGPEAGATRNQELGTRNPASGAPLAVLFRYTCHATAMGGQNYLITADYPGAAAAFVERAYHGQTVALFLQGCAGNVRPFLSRMEGGFRSADWAELARIGRELGAATIAAAEGAAARDGAVQPLAVAGKTILLPFDSPPPAAELRRLLDDGQWSDGRGLTQAERSWAERTLERATAGTLPPGNQAEVQVFRLGPAWLVTLPGEVFVEIGWRVRDAVAAAAGVPPDNVIVAAYTNGSVGYVPTAAAIPEGGYEVTAYRHSGWPACYVPQAEELLAQTAAELAAALRRPDLPVRAA